MNLPLDQMSQREIDNGEAASYQLLGNIDAKEHTLATAYYGAPIWYSLNGAKNATAFIHYNVPPQVTKAGLVVYACGVGSIVITVEDEAGSAIDSTGTELPVDTGATATYGDNPLVAQTVFAMNTDSSADADEQRLITVASSASWDWQTCVIKFVFATDCKGFGCTVVPLHVPA